MLSQSVKQMDFIALFPVVVGKALLEIQFTKEEKKALFLSDPEMREDIPSAFGVSLDGNQHIKTSKNTYILESPVLSNFKKVLEDNLNAFFKEIWKPNTDCTIYITQSWLTNTKEGQYLYRHFHANSLISGVFYLEANPQTDSITFFSNHPQPQLLIFPTEYTLFNSESWLMEVGTNNLLMFPSTLHHMVTSKKGSNRRISLAFNTFIKGDIGDISTLSKLILK